MNGSLDIRISERDAVAIIQALNQRMSVLPLSTAGNGENEFGSWVDWMGDNTLVNILTDKLAASVAARFAECVYSRAYWAKYERAKRLVIHFVWPFKRKEVA